MSRNWSAIARTFDAWSDVLQELVQQAEDSANAGNAAGCRAVAQELSSFILNSPDGVNGVPGLDQRAEQIARDLLTQNIDQAVTSLAARSRELATYTEQIKQTAAEAESDASAIRLQDVTQLLTGANQVIASAKKIRAALKDDGDSAALVTEIDTALAQVEALLPKIRNLTDG